MNQNRIYLVKVKIKGPRGKMNNHTGLRQMAALIQMVPSQNEKKACNSGQRIKWDFNNAQVESQSIKANKGDRLYIIQKNKQSCIKQQ